MKKKYVLIALLFASGFGFSQSRYTIVQFNKKDVPAVIGEIPFSEGTVKEALDKNFEKQGYKGKKVKDFLVYNGVAIKEVDSTMTHDLYMMVERKSRQEKEVSVVTFLIGKGFDSFANDTADAAVISNIKTYLLSLREVVAAFDLELQISAQEDLIKKADKKYNNLLEDGMTLFKKKKKIEEEITLNGVETNNQKTDTERQKQILSTLKAKRKNINF